MRTAHVVRSIAGNHHQIQEIVLDEPANEYTLSNKQAFANFRSAGTGCPRYSESTLANFARVLANFAKKATKCSQKPKADVAISPTSKSEIDSDEPGVMSYFSLPR